VHRPRFLARDGPRCFLTSGNVPAQILRCLRVAFAKKWVIMTLMRKASIANAKAHFSELVDLAEHKGQRTLILRHGKPAAAIVPAEVLVVPTAALTAEQAKALLDGLAMPESHESIEDLLGRRRLDRIK
jgi:prevent-host-death family protein